MYHVRTRIQCALNLGGRFDTALRTALLRALEIASRCRYYCVFHANMPPARPNPRPKTVPEWTKGTVNAPRQHRKEPDPFTWTKIVELRTSAGWSWNQIFTHFQREIPMSTLRSTVSRANKRVNNISQSRSGRPRKLTDDDIAKINKKIEENPKVSYEDLLAEVDHKVERSSIWRVLAEGRLSKMEKSGPS